MTDTSVAHDRETKRYPLSFTQEWFVTMDKGDDGGAFGRRYLLVSALRITGPVDLAVLQGATELFPVSSLGHAVVVPALFNLGVDQAVAGEAAPRLELGTDGRIGAGHSDEIALAALHLASEESSYTTGASLVCDGGVMIR